MLHSLGVGPSTYDPHLVKHVNRWQASISMCPTATTCSVQEFFYVLFKSNRPLCNVVGQPYALCMMQTPDGTHNSAMAACVH